MGFGVDPKSGVFYAQNDESPLIVLRPDGVRLKEYTLTSRPRTKPAATRQILVHPGGGKLLVLTDSALFFVERIGEE